MAIMKTTGVEADFHYFRSERNGFNHAVECEDRDAYLAVDKQIVDKVLSFSSAFFQFEYVIRLLS